MKHINNVMYCIRARDRLEANPENTILLYGNDDQFMFMADLCRWLTTLAPQRLVEFIHYAYDEEGTVGEIYFGGEEITANSLGEYYKIQDGGIYVLKDTETGLQWEFAHKDICIL